MSISGEEVRVGVGGVDWGGQSGGCRQVACCRLPSPPPPPNQHSVEDKPEFQKAPVNISARLEPLSSWLPPALQPARLVLSCIDHQFDDVEPLQRTVWSGWPSKNWALAGDFPCFELVVFALSAFSPQVWQFSIKVSKSQRSFNQSLGELGQSMKSNPPPQLLSGATRNG